jgi:hypothetical protein
MFFIDFLVDHFWRKFQDFSGKLLGKFKKSQTWVCIFKLNLIKHAHTKIQLASFYPDGLRQNFDHFWRFFLDFLKENLEISKYEKSSE